MAGAGNPGGFISFAEFAEWQAFLLRLSLNDAIPQIVTAKFERAQKLHLLAWIDFDLIKAGELVALTTLELALQDRYGGKIKARGNNPKPKNKNQSGRLASKAETGRLAELLKFMPDHDGLTDAQIPMICCCGGTVVRIPDGPTQAEPRRSSQQRSARRSVRRFSNRRLA